MPKDRSARNVNHSSSSSNNINNVSHHHSSSSGNNGTTLNGVNNNHHHHSTNNNNNHHQTNNNNNNNNGKGSKAMMMANGNNNNSTHTSLNSAMSNSFNVSRKQTARDREKEQREREKIVLWRRPVQTIKYCILECLTLLQTYGQKLLQHKFLLSLFMVVVAVIAGAYHVPGTHQMYIDVIRRNLWFVTYWMGLGVLSSVGLGTGLHTFILYLGPHIASVTLAAYECNSLNFPTPPYPDEIVCPDEIDAKFIPSLWNIMSKVRYEAFLWGAGTALGELPPYFMAKAARLSGYDPEDGDDLQKLEELKKRSEQGVQLSALERSKIAMESVVERVGFFGILACASIPNPLFDLAGITCGHFLVPFWTFFGATLIGKAVIKMHIQKVFVIIAFNESLIEKAIDLLTDIPVVGRLLQEPFKAFLVNQKARLHRGRGGSEGGAASGGGGNLLARIFEKFVIAMIIYFVVSIINSLAQSWHKRIHKKMMMGKVHRKIARD